MKQVSQIHKQFMLKVNNYIGWTIISLNIVISGTSEPFVYNTPYQILE